MSDTLRISKANPIRLVIRQWDELTATMLRQAQHRLFKEIGAPFFDQSEYLKPWEKADKLYLQLVSSFDTTNKARICAYPSLDVVIDEIDFFLSTTVNGEEVYDFTLDWSGIDDGDYVVQLYGSDADTKTYLIQSEPLKLADEWSGSVGVEYYNFEDCFDTAYRTGVRFVTRLPGRFIKPADEYESQLYDDDSRALSVLEAQVNSAIMLELFRISAFEAQLVNRYLSHDYVAIDGQRIASGNRLKHDYGYHTLLASPSVALRLQDESWSNSHDDNVAAVQPVVDLLAVALSDTEIQLTFTNDKATKIYRSDDDGDTYTLVYTTGAGAEVWTNTGLTEDTTYHFYAVAVDGSRESVDSEVVSVELSTWMLSGGIWNDSGVWYDGNNWED